jgi:hypothetical protein
MVIRPVGGCIVTPVLKTSDREMRVPYTIWKNGEKLGETRFELRPGPHKMAGVFHPTASAMAVLPSVTAMMPALFAFGRMCRARGIDVDESRPETVDRGLDAFANSPEGKRIQAAARHVAELELVDAAGHALPWDSILISDLTNLAELSGNRDEARRRLECMPGDPIRFMISVTLADPSAPLEPFGGAEPAEVC